VREAKHGVVAAVSDWKSQLAAAKKELADEEEHVRRMEAQGIKAGREKQLQAAKDRVARLQKTGPAGASAEAKAGLREVEKNDPPYFASQQAKQEGEFAALPQSEQESRRELRRKREEWLAKQRAEAIPNVVAELSGFTLDRANDSYIFTIRVTNQGSTDILAYPIVYGKKKSGDFWAWPVGAEGCVDRPNLTPADYSRHWEKTLEADKIIGGEFRLEAGKSQSMEGALLSPQDTVSDVYLWVFSQEGKLIFEKHYDVK
jgi:hypothetical protein